MYVQLHTSICTHLWWQCLPFLDFIAFCFNAVRFVIYKMRATYTQFIEYSVWTVCVCVSIRFTVWKTLQLYTHTAGYRRDQNALCFRVFFYFMLSLSRFSSTLPLIVNIETNCIHSSVKWNQCVCVCVPLISLHYIALAPANCKVPCYYAVLSVLLLLLWFAVYVFNATLYFSHSKKKE